MANYTGLNANTPKHLLLDAGVFVKNYDFTKSFEQQTAANIIGATQGGGTFSAIPTVRKVEVDGAKENVKQLQHIDGWVVTLTANVKEVTANNLQLALGAAESMVITSGSAETAYAGATKITGKDDFEATDYAANLAWVGKESGGTGPVIISIDNALCVNGLSLTMADKAEAVIPVTVTGHYGLDDLETPPFKIIFPVISTT